MPVDTITRVHTEETTAQFDPIPTYGLTLRRSCYPQWLMTERVYELLDDRKDRTRADRLRFCRSTAWFYRHNVTGEVRIASNACHLRWCPVCGQARRNFISHAVAEWISKQAHPKFLTLTLKHTNAPLEWQVENLYSFFRELRRRKEFKRCVTGGIWFFQIKKSKTDHLWHPHLHCLITGSYLSKHKLHRMWCQVTFGSFVADIRTVHDPQKAAHDAAKYAASPGTLSGLSTEDACELVDAMHRRRICGTWGTGRTVSLRPAKQIDKDEWTNVGTWTNILNTRDSDPNARAIINAWKDKTSLPDGISCHYFDESHFDMHEDPQQQLTLDEVYKAERNPP